MTTAAVPPEVPKTVVLDSQVQGVKPPLSNPPFVIAWGQALVATAVTVVEVVVVSVVDEETTTTLLVVTVWLAVVVVTVVEVEAVTVYGKTPIQEQALAYWLAPVHADAYEGMVFVEAARAAINAVEDAVSVSTSVAELVTTVVLLTMTVEV